MPRRKSILKLPFIKAKINRKTVFNMFGFFLIAAGMILLISFFNIFATTEDKGKILTLINQLIINKFGGLAILTPFIILLVAGHFFNTKKLKFIKFNITGGILLIFISLLGFFNAGEFGKIISENLKTDFLQFGAMVILSVIFLIGLILFLDTSVDVFILFLISIIKSALEFIKKYILRSSFERKSKKKISFESELPKEEEFIQDKKTAEKNKIVTMTQNVRIPLPSISQKEFLIKPISTSNSSTWIYPPLNLLFDQPQQEADRGDVKRNADIIEKTLDSFGIRAHVVELNKGPAVTQYALEIARGTKLSKITVLANDLALALAAPTGQVRIEAPIPGRALVGIEIPNRRPEIVTLKRLLSSPLFTKNPDSLLVPLGLDVSGEPQATTIAKMPHVLIAGQTGAGKSVLLNSWICTLLFRTKPENLRLILVDPKRVELTLYNGIPHLYTDVVVEPDKIISALKWTINEMENRYKEFAKLGVRNIEGYNETEGVEKKPYVLFVIDELATLMTYAPGDAEGLITKIAQMSRATGIHLILATQRPSVDVITGLMKANIPARIAFNVSSMIDSRVIIDMPGAEKLLGRGDMLFLPPDQAKPKRIQGPFITEKEVNQLVKFLRTQQPEVHYTQEITEQEVILNNRGGTAVLNSNDKDPFFNMALETISQFDKASASLLQRRLKVGYARAARLLDQLEAAGYVSPSEGPKPREVLKRNINPNSV